MLDLNEAINRSLFFTLEAPVRSLGMPVHMMRKLQESGKPYVWQLAMLSKRQILEMGFDKSELKNIVYALKQRNLNTWLRMTVELRCALALNWQMTVDDIDTIICRLVGYVQDNEVSDDTFVLIMWQRDLAREKIETHRKKTEGLIALTAGFDRYGLQQYYGTGIMPT